MFNLDQAIFEWRRKMISAGIKSSDVLDELEGHLREDIERRVRAGADASRVFEVVAERFGEPCALKMEFDRVKKQQRKYMKRGMMIGGGIVGVMVGMALVMPAVAQYRQIGAMHRSEPWLFLIGSLITLAGCYAGAKGLIKKRA